MRGTAHLFDGCGPDVWAVVEVLWKHRQADAPAWWRTRVMEVEPDPGRPRLRVGWGRAAGWDGADPATSMMEPADVADFRACPDVLPVSCVTAPSRRRATAVTTGRPADPRRRSPRRTRTR